MPDDHEKETAFEELKAELRTHADAREFLQLLRFSKEEPLDGESLAEEVASLLERCWEQMIAAGDDYIPVIGHPDPQVCDYIMRSMLARLRTEGRPVPRLLRNFREDLIAGPVLNEPDVIVVDPETEDTPERAPEKTRIQGKTFCVFMLVRIGTRCTAAIEGGLTATRNDASLEYSVCDAVREILDEIGHELSYFGVVRCWREGRREFPDLA